MTTIDRARLAAKALDSKKAVDIKILHIGTLTTIGDYFVVATGNSTTQVKALADEVDRNFAAQGILPKRIEGYSSSASWILMDYSDILIHIFLKETREFYALERLWSDAPEVSLE